MQAREASWRKELEEQKIQDNDKKLLNIFRFGICPLRVASFAV